MTIKTCDKCNTSYSLTWGSHYCMADLPELPEEFRETEMRNGQRVPKRDYHDRKAWLEVHTGQVWGDWRAIAAVYRDNAQLIAKAAEARELEKAAATV